MRALVTGATGFVGRALVHKLLEGGHDITCLVRRDCAPRFSGISMLAGDLADPQSLAIDRRNAGRFDVVFHLGALIRKDASESDARFIETNAIATIALLEAAERGAAGKLVYMSSTSVIGLPRSVPITEQHPVAPRSQYAMGKLAGELACELARARGFHATALRLSSPYGSDMDTSTVLPIFVGRALSGQPVRWHGNGARKQDFIFIDDVVAACIAAAEAHQSGLYNVGSGVGTSSRALAEAIGRLVPGCVTEASGQPDPQEHVSWQLDMSRTAYALGFAAQTPLDEGIAQYMATRKSAVPKWTWW